MLLLNLFTMTGWSIDIYLGLCSKTIIFRASKIAMLNPLPLGDSTIKVTSDHYQRLLTESTTLQQQLSSFGGALSKTLVTLSLRNINWRPSSILEMKELRQNVNAMMERTRQALQRECHLIVEVTGSIRKLSHEFRQLIELMKDQQERSTQKISDLVNQLKTKTVEIERCQIGVENERNRQTEQAWRQQHYANVIMKGDGHPVGITYLQALKDLRTILETQIANQRREQRNFTLGIMGKLKDFKSRLLKVWYLLPLKKDPPRPPSPVPSDEDIKREISQLERRYLLREQVVDEFEVQDLAEIKKKLKLLEQAEMSESREYLNYSASLEQQRNVVESEVVELLHS